MKHKFQNSKTFLTFPLIRGGFVSSSGFPQSGTGVRGSTSQRYRFPDLRYASSGNDKLAKAPPSLKLRRAGFTLLEMLLVIAIIAILAGIVLVAINPMKQLNQARTAKALSGERELNNAIMQYLIDKGTYPFQTEGLAQTTHNICKQGVTESCGVNLDALVSDGIYLNEIPLDEVHAGLSTTGFLLEYSMDRVQVGTIDTSDCPEGYVKVQGSALYSTDDFCVMKYEAKNVDGVATSQASGTLWSSITQTNAIAECSDIGEGYHLITNNEWMTIARNIEQLGDNWTGGEVGSGTFYTGHMDNVPPNPLIASTDDNDPYYGTGQSAPNYQRRTHYLVNGEVIWDLAGNMWEWTSDSITCAATNCTTAEMPFDESPASEWVDPVNLTGFGLLSYDDLRPSNPSWGMAQRIGRVYTDANQAAPNTTTHVLLRSGRWAYSSHVGIYMLYFGYGPDDTAHYIGFRCSYRPQ